MSEVQIDQGVYDQLIGSGMSERMARAKAKAATVRKQRATEGWALGPRSAEDHSSKMAAWKEKAGASGGGVAVATKTGDGGAAGGRLTPEERAARVAASLGITNDRSAGSAQLGIPAQQDHTHRLLALIPPNGIQQTKTKQDDKVYTWPHLLIVEFVALLAIGGLLLVASYFLDAPLGDLANVNETPAVTKAPWYFMGLQELLRYFHPMIAGVTIPGVGMIILGATAYFDKNPSARPENRKFAMLSMTWFLQFWMVLTIIGSFLRGPGYEWVWPWVENLYFEL